MPILCQIAEKVQTMLMNTAVSIIICTCNRAEHLRQTLAAMARVCVPDDLPAELLVMDNASTDDTAEVVKGCRLPNMPVRYIYEQRRGQCYARNTGMAEARGNIFLFMDDDVRPPQNWIQDMCGPILGGVADVVAGGVRIASHLERNWMERMHRDWLAETEGIQKDAPERMVGANMAFSQKVLDKVPCFDVELGPGASGFGDETLFAWQLREAGYRMISAFDVTVEHHFDEARLRRESLLDAAKKFGQSDAYILYHWEHRPDRFPRLRLALSRMELLYLRLKHWKEWRDSESCPEWELLQVRKLWFYKRYLIEMRKPHHYQRHGLTKGHCS